jgi:hypothetical protein
MIDGPPNFSLLNGNIPAVGDLPQGEIYVKGTAVEAKCQYECFGNEQVLL